MTAIDFALLARNAAVNANSLKQLMLIAFGAGFMARLAEKELCRLGIAIERSHDS